jgi:hypothetical protein
MRNDKENIIVEKSFLFALKTEKDNIKNSKFLKKQPIKIAYEFTDT